ncbi:hypothetical protein EON82_01795, partial [bacterium]
MINSRNLTFAAALGTMLLVGAPSPAYAQQDPAGQMISSLEFEQTDVREALRALFKNVGVSYTIAPEVQGTVTVSLKNVPFETALQNVTRQVDATYRIEGGVYQIVRREDPPVVTSGAQDQLGTITSNRVRRRIKIRYADPQFIAILLGADKGSQNFSLYPEISTVQNTPTTGGMGGMMGGMGGMGGGMGGGMMGGMGGMGGGMMGGMGGMGGGM